MSRFRPRLRALAALVALCLSVGPAASALCPHPDGKPPSAPQETDAAAMTAGTMDEMPPCHDVPPAPEPSEDADCASPCCVAAAAPALVTADALTVDVSAALAAWESARLPLASAFAGVAVPPRAPPRRVLEPSVRLQV